MARSQAGLRTEARIMAATRDLLSEVGLAGTPLKEICDRAGIRAGSFYNLFESKEEVVLRVVGEAIAAVDPDPEHRHTDTIADLVEAYIAFVTGSPNISRNVACNSESNLAMACRRLARNASAWSRMAAIRFCVEYCQRFGQRSCIQGWRAPLGFDRSPR